jgi:Holliday junction resolvase-like predicted endonuclease
MLRENVKTYEIKTSHELSGKINKRKYEKICRIENEYFINSKIEMRFDRGISA